MWGRLCQGPLAGSPLLDSEAQRVGQGARACVPQRRGDPRLGRQGLRQGMANTDATGRGDLESAVRRKSTNLNRGGAVLLRTQSELHGN